MTFLCHLPTGVTWTAAEHLFWVLTRYSSVPHPSWAFTQVSPWCGSLCWRKGASCHASTRLPGYERHGDAVFTVWQGGSRLKHLFTCCKSQVLPHPPLQRCGMDAQRCLVRCLQTRLYGNILDLSSGLCSQGKTQRNRSHRETGREPFSR